MSGLDLALVNLVAWSVQVAVLVLAAAAAQRLLPWSARRPGSRCCSSCWPLALLLPFLQPWRAAAPGVAWSIRLASGPRAAAAPHVAGALPQPRLPCRGLASTVVAVLLAGGALVQLARLGLRLARLRSPAPHRDAARHTALAARAARRGRALRPGRDLRRRARPGDLRPAPAAGAAAAGAAVHCPRRTSARCCCTSWCTSGAATGWRWSSRRRIAAVLFFHPAVHWLLGRVRLAREQCVDAEVVSRLGGRHAYLESLVEVARFSATSRAVPAATFLTESHLRERVDLLLKEVAMSRLRTLAHVALTAAALVLAVSWTASAVPLQAAKPAAATIDLRDDVSGGEMKLVKKVPRRTPRRRRRRASRASSSWRS